MAFAKTTFAALVTSGLVFFAQAKVPQVEGYKLTWSDDFVGTANSLPNTADWKAQTGTQYEGGAANWGTNEIETYTSSTQNVALTGNGSLAITAIKDQSGAWTSARLETTRSDFGAKQGGKMRIQGSLSLPDVGETGTGFWPAFWTLGANFRKNVTDWPRAGELDIMENVNGINKVYGTMHCGIYGGGPCDETNGLSGNTVPTGAPAQGSFHTYTVEVDRTDAAEEAIRWYLDGEQYWEVLSTTVEEQAWTSAIHTSYFIIMNLAIGGSFPDKVYGSTTPIESTQSKGTMLIDYVAVYHST